MSYGHERSEPTQTNLPLQNVIINFQVFGYFEVRLQKQSYLNKYCLLF